MIRCQKEIVSSSGDDLKMMKGHFRRDFELGGEDGTRFRLFVRVNEYFPENFSVGLLFLPRGIPEEPVDPVPLVRCNGPNGPSAFDHHILPHIHRATEENIRAGMKPGRHIQPTLGYNDWR